MNTYNITLFLLLFTISGLLISFTITDIAALKAEGTSNKKFGAETSDIVCGNTLCDTKESKNNVNKINSELNILFLSEKGETIYSTNFIFKGGVENTITSKKITKSDTMVFSDFNNDGILDKAEIHAAPLTYEHHGFYTFDPKENQARIVLSIDENRTSFKNFHIDFTRPKQIVSSDFNNDGNQDILINTSETYQRTCQRCDEHEFLFLFLGDGNGGFEKEQYPVIESMSGLKIRDVLDFDLDGNIDILYNLDSDRCFGYTSCRGILLFGNGDGTFEHAHVLKEESFRSADIDDDGTEDFISKNWDDNSYSITTRKNNSVHSKDLEIRREFVPIGFVDINNDSKMDLLSVNSNTNTILFYFGDGKGNFKKYSEKEIQFDKKITARDSSSWDRKDFVNISDINYDGNKDLVVHMEKSRVISILLGDGNGNFLQSKNIDLKNNSMLLKIIIK